MGRARTFLIAVAAGLLTAGPILYYAGPPDLASDLDLGDFALFVLPPAAMTAVVALTQGCRPPWRVLLALLSGSGVMTAMMFSAVEVPLWLGAVIPAVVLAGAAFGQAIGTLGAVIAAAVIPTSGVWVHRYLPWGCTVIGVLGALALALTGFALSLDRMTVDYWVGAGQALSVLALSTAAAGLVVIVALGRPHAAH